MPAATVLGVETYVSAGGLTGYMINGDIMDTPHIAYLTSEGATVSSIIPELSLILNNYYDAMILVM
jgi:hypothetical protein